ncbi:MAG: TrmH family RNA methyltransferase [bacterium]
MKESSRRIVILDNLRSGYNTGSIYRTACSFSFTDVLHVGTTPNTENASFKKASRGCEDYLSSGRFDCMRDALKSLPESIHLYALEICSRSIPLSRVKIPRSFAVIVGNEALGVSEHALSASDSVIEIETTGRKHSLNVASSFAIFAYNAGRHVDSD